MKDALVSLLVSCFLTISPTRRLGRLASQFPPRLAPRPWVSLFVEPVEKVKLRDFSKNFFAIDQQATNMKFFCERQGTAWRYNDWRPSFWFP
jgi:hypothetical protein